MSCNYNANLGIHSLHSIWEVLKYSHVTYTMFFLYFNQSTALVVMHQTYHMEPSLPQLQFLEIEDAGEVFPNDNFHGCKIIAK